MSTERSAGHLRLADLLAALSVATDLGQGHPVQEAMRGCLLATRLAREMGLTEAEVSDVYYTTLLRYVGCTAYAHEEAALFGERTLPPRPPWRQWTSPIRETPYRSIPAYRLDEVVQAFADFVDLKSPSTRGHSPAVADLAEGSGAAEGR